jgi:hypothetical protein
MLRWSDILSYMQPRTGFTLNGGAISAINSLRSGPMRFWASDGVYDSDGVTAYNAYRTAFDAAQPLTAQFDGSLSANKADYDSRNGTWRRGRGRLRLHRSRPRHRQRPQV